MVHVCQMNLHSLPLPRTHTHITTCCVWWWYSMSVHAHACIRTYVCISLYSTVHVWGLHWFEILHGWTGNVPTVLFRNTSWFQFNLSFSPFLFPFSSHMPPLPISISGCENRQPRLCGRGRWGGSSRLPQAHPAVHGGLPANWPPTWPGTQLAQGVQCGPEVRGQPNSRLVGGAEGCVMCWWLCAVPERAVIGWHALYVRKSTGVCSSTCCSRVSVLVCPCAHRPLIYVCMYIRMYKTWFKFSYSICTCIAVYTV